MAKVKKSPGGLRRRFAFTIVELLVVIGVISLLLALLMPAMEQAREAARRIRCASNLRQLGVALNSYQGTHDAYPFASSWAPGGLTSGVYPPGVVDLSNGGATWREDRFFSGCFLMLLPELGQEPTYAAWNLDLSVSSPANWTTRGVNLGQFICPSDPYAQTSRCSLQGGNWARGNYALNAGPDPACIRGLPFGAIIPGFDSVDCQSLYPGLSQNIGVRINPVSLNKVYQVWGSGVAGVNKVFRPQDIPDGASKTVAFEEIVAGRSAHNRNGVWAMPLISSSITFGHGSWSRKPGPNPLSAPFLDDESGNVSLQGASRSYHPGGVQVVMIDGAVAFVANSVDLQVWNAMHTRDGGE